MQPASSIAITAEKRGAQPRPVGHMRQVCLLPGRLDSPPGRLVQLTLHYMGNQPDRICAVTRGTEVPGHEEISASPRMLRFIDVPPETMFLPQAAELDGGRVVTFFSALTEKLRQDQDSRVAEYPATVATDKGKRQRDAYWQWYADHWKTRK